MPEQLQGAMQGLHIDCRISTAASARLSAERHHEQPGQSTVPPWLHSQKAVRWLGQRDSRAGRGRKPSTSRGSVSVGWCRAVDPSKHRESAGALCRGFWPPGLTR